LKRNAFDEYDLQSDTILGLGTNRRLSGLAIPVFGERFPGLGMH
jgi:hypothetical protein